MSEFLSRLGGAALNDLKGTPLDRIVNHLMGGQPGASGLQALVDRLRGAGLADRVESWIGTGDNKPVAPQELERALGADETQRIAQDAGMERPGLLALLSQVLPRLIDGLTPNGRLPQAGEAPAGGGFGDLIASVLGRLGGAGAGAGAGGAQGQEGAIPTAGRGATVYGGPGGDAAHAVGRGAGGEAGMPRFSPAAPDPNDPGLPASGVGGPPLPSGPDRA